MRLKTNSETLVVTIKTKRWNVANRHAADCRSSYYTIKNSWPQVRQ